ncbi:MAG: subtilisin-like serine [Prolixibacteraceae bacterium]|nr:MAG: subtilisin-like serine [Prolixibacteraceae bacterium]
MKKLTIVGIAIVLTVAVFHSCNEPLTEDVTSNELSLKSADVAKSYIVVLNDAELNAGLANQTGYEAKQKMAKSAAERIIKRAGITDGELGFVYGTAIKGFSLKIAPGQLKKLQDDPSVEYIEEDQVVTLVLPDVKVKAKPPKPTAPSQTIPWGITRVGGPTSSTGAKAWIIDTGIDLTHPDLNVSTTLGKSFVTGVVSPNDDNGHGTHCAGIVAAVNNSFGVVGVSAGATVVPVKVLNRQGSGTYTAIIAGVDYVASNASSSAGDVANMSLGGAFSQALNDAVIAASAKVKFTLAAGNESTSATTKSPASANGPNIYTISAMGQGDVWATYSNYDNPPVDYCEPGSNIYSTYKGGGYATLSGTSMAAPHAAGLLLLGNITSGGQVSGDPDGAPDIIGVRLK